MTRVRVAGFSIFFAGVLACLPACSKKGQPPDAGGGNTVRGKVTYKGELVPYGFVLFFKPEVAFDPVKKTTTPLRVAAIMEGKYEATDLPTGPMVICLLTDPEQDTGLLMGAGTKKIEPGPPIDKGAFPGKDLPRPPKDGPPPPLSPAALNPLTKKLTDAQKKTLKEIHGKYGTLGASPLLYPVKEGIQSFDLDLK